MNVREISMVEPVRRWKKITLIFRQALMRMNEWRRSNADHAYGVRPRCCRAEHVGEPK